MFNAKYKKGMADAAKAYEAFGEKQEAALNHILEEVRQGRRESRDAMEEVSRNFDNVYNYLDSKQKEELYTLNTPFDIKNLELKERQFLAGALFTLAQDKRPTENQQKYIQAVYAYLGIQNPSPGVDPLAIEKMENLTDQRAIYQVILEYLFLQDGDGYDETELQQEFLDTFSLNPKGRETIRHYVENLHRTVGIQGLVEKYGYTPIEAAKVEKQPDLTECDEIDNVVSGWTNLTSCVGTLIFDTSATDMDNVIESLDRHISKSKCEQMARTAVRKIYDEASSFFSTSSSKSLSKEACDNVMDSLENDFSKIEHFIRMMDYTSKVEEPISRLRGYLDLDKARSELKKALDEELRDSYYQLYDFDYFIDKVEIESDDMEMESGFFRLLEAAGASYTFNATDSYLEIVDDARKYAKTFEENADRIIQELFGKKYADRIKEITDEIRKKAKS